MDQVSPSSLLIASAVTVALAPSAPATAQTPLTPPATGKAGQGAPNVLWILLDDVGYGASSAFGGLIETPNLDALAAQGLRYTNFHTTAISAPTRAAMLTGRNHHSVGTGLFAETAVDLPGYNAKIPASKATVAEILGQGGYATFAVGKWHLTPVEETGPAGPYQRWPTGKGFGQYYGFLFGETDQWHPQLVENTHGVADDPQGRHLNELLTDKAIAYLGGHRQAHPTQPFFLYYAPGAQGGTVSCRPQRSARDCNERSLLRRYGAGVKILTMYREEEYTEYREEQVQSATVITGAITLDGGVGGRVF